MQLTQTHITVKNQFGKPQSIPVEPFTEAFIWDCFAQGFDIRVQRAGAKVDKDEPDKDEKIVAAKLEVFEKLRQGIIPSGGGGGGSRLDATSRGWIEYFRAIGHKEAGNPVNGKTVDRAIDWYCRDTLLQAHPAGSDKRKDIESNMAKWLADYRDKILEAAESDESPGMPGAFIRIEHDRDAANNATNQSTMPKGLKIG